MALYNSSLPRRAIDWAIRRITQPVLCARDQRTCTYLLENSPEIGRLPVIMSSDVVSVSDQVLRHYLDHRFDLLGSGWVRVIYGMRCRGLEGHQYHMGEPIVIDSDGRWLEGRVNRANLSEAQRIWRLVDTDYVPIDWHLDFKSGYRWLEATWYRDIRHSHLPGVDVKVPWELARMQHLPQMALGYLHSVQQNKPWDALVREFRNQVLDFIATNPPRFGVNWACAMDVAIRVTNWLFAYDLFLGAGAGFDEDFENVFRRSVYEHGRHIVRNLEWFNGVRGNHYLADIGGLLFVAAHLARSGETDAWLAFAVQELIGEVGYQFHQDGSNFEGSTAYHRLSGEIAVYCTALVLGLPEDKQEALRTYNHRLVRGRPRLRPAPLLLHDSPGNPGQGSASRTPFPLWYFDRIERMAEFVGDITKPCGHISQIGDNDSGRFVKLTPTFRSMTVKDAVERYPSLAGYRELPEDAPYLMEDHLDCRHLVAAVCGLVDRPDLSSWVAHASGYAGRHPDTVCIEALAGGLRAPSQRGTTDARTVGSETDFDPDSCLRDPEIPRMEAHARQDTRVTRFEASPGDLREGLTCLAYPDFGLYLLKSDRLYLALRCWTGEWHHPGGHFHNDQMSVELTLDGRDLVVDPGTYLYTPFPEQRNRYRSVHAHFTPWRHDREPAGLDEDLFRLAEPPRAEITDFGTRGIVSTILTRPAVSRTCTVSAGSVTIIDRLFGAQLGERRSRQAECLLSPGYGILADHPNMHIAPILPSGSFGDV